jgi:hypothetical protein
MAAPGNQALVRVRERLARYTGMIAMEARFGGFMAARDPAMAPRKPLEVGAIIRVISRDAGF